MVKVLWVSRHDMTKEQIEDLERITGDSVEITKFDKTCTSAFEILKKVEEHSILAVVLPVELLSDLMQLKPEDVPMLISKNARKRNSDGEYVFTHDRWVKVDYCVYSSHELEPYELQLN